jgi:hypothetical protein
VVPRRQCASAAQRAARLAPIRVRLPGLLARETGVREGPVGGFPGGGGEGDGEPGGGKGQGGAVKGGGGAGEGGGSGGDASGGAEPPSPPPTKITGLTGHGADQVMSRDGGHGVNDGALQDAVSHPTQSPVFGVDQHGRGAYIYFGRDATVFWQGCDSGLEHGRASGNSLGDQP